MNNDGNISEMSASHDVEDPVVTTGNGGGYDAADPAPVKVIVSKLSEDDSMWASSYGGGSGPAVENYGNDHDDLDEDASHLADGERGVESLCADLSCLCVPTCTSGPRDLCYRLGIWSLANADQFISSIIVAISLIPESISYALIAGLPPSAALQSCWITNVITAIVGGRPGMITSASGLAGLLLWRLVNTATVVEENGIMFVPYVVIFAGILQCLAAFVGLGRLVSSFPAPVVVGVVNAMALLMLALQCRYAKEFPLTRDEITGAWDVEGTAPAADVTWNVALFAYFGKGFQWISPWLDLGIYGAEVATAFITCMFLPRLTTFLPATLVAVLVTVAVEFGLARQFDVQTPLIGDYGGAQVVAPWTTIFNSNYNLPSLASWESWKLILGYGSALFATQFTETAIALNVVDRLDESQGPGFQVLIGQGVANAVSGIMGGMGGSGVVSMSVLADRTFGTTCLSTFMTGALMFVFVTYGYHVIDYIPLSAVSGISIAMVCSFIQWRSMVATLTTCLPSSKRDLLPPQYNIARLDVLVMLLVTAACLIVDVATLLFFVMGLGIFAYSAVRACIDRRKRKYDLEESYAEGDEENDYVGRAHLEGAESDSQGEIVANQDEVLMVDDEVEVVPDVNDSNNNGANGVGACPSWDCRLMEQAEGMIFPEHGDDLQLEKLS